MVNFFGDEMHQYGICRMRRLSFIMFFLQKNNVKKFVFLCSLDVLFCDFYRMERIKIMSTYPEIN